jgi:hypothetical protein
LPFFQDMQYMVVGLISAKAGCNRSAKPYEIDQIKSAE